MKTAEEILKNTFEPDGFSIEKALNISAESIIADPAYKRILFAMKKYGRLCALQALVDAAEKSTILHHDGFNKTNSSIKYYQAGADNLQVNKLSILNTPILTP